MAESLDTLRRELPDGAFWPTGGWMRRLLSALISDRARLAQGSGQEIPVDGQGRFFVIDAAGGSVAAAVPVSFELLDVSTSVKKLIRVRQGVVNTPQGPWIPTGMTSGDAEPFVMEVGDAGFVVLIVTVNSGTGEVNSVTIGVKPVPGAGLPIAVNTATVGHLVLGSFGVTEGGAFVVKGAVGDQNYLHCGESHYFWGARADE